jgi:hypothetical protein
MSYIEYWEEVLFHAKFPLNMKDGFYYCCSCRIGVEIEHTTLNILVVLVGNSQVHREKSIFFLRIVRNF